VGDNAAAMEDVKARDGRTVVVSKAETGEGHAEGGWERERGVYEGAVANARWVV
jgi:hypothetical protein